MTTTRKASHAGSWYTDNGKFYNARSQITIIENKKKGKQLDKELTNWLNQADAKHAPSKAIISPHAGYTYCGACAAFAYKNIDPTNM